MHFFISDIYALFWLMVLLWSKASLKFFWYLKKCFVEEVNEILSPGLMDLIDIHLANIFMGKMSFFFMRKERNFDDFFGDSFGTKLRIVIVIRQTVKGVTHPPTISWWLHFCSIVFPSLWSCHHSDRKVQPHQKVGEQTIWLEATFPYAQSTVHYVRKNHIPHDTKINSAYKCKQSVIGKLHLL